MFILQNYKMSKRKALGGDASDHQFGAFPYTIASLERENRALKRQLLKANEEVERLTNEIGGGTVIEVDDTLNRVGNRLVVEVVYTGIRQTYPIPDDVDLENTQQVNNWYVHLGTLIIEYNGDRPNDEIEIAHTNEWAEGDIQKYVIADAEEFDVTTYYPDDP